MNKNIRESSTHRRQNEGDSINMVWSGTGRSIDATGEKNDSLEVIGTIWGRGRPKEI